MTTNDNNIFGVYAFESILFGRVCMFHSCSPAGCSASNCKMTPVKMRSWQCTFKILVPPAWKYPGLCSIIWHINKCGTSTRRSISDCFVASCCDPLQNFRHALRASTRLRRRMFLPFNLKTSSWDQPLADPSIHQEQFSGRVLCRRSFIHTSSII